MGKVPIQLRKRKVRSKFKHAKRDDVLENKFRDFEDQPIDSQYLLISTLLPPAVKAFMEELEREVTQVCGRRYEHGKAMRRWGTQKGLIIAAKQSIAVEKPRVRSKDGREAKLSDV